MRPRHRARWRAELPRGELGAVRPGVRGSRLPHRRGVGRSKFEPFVDSESGTGWIPLVSVKGAAKSVLVFDHSGGSASWPAAASGVESTLRSVSCFPDHLS